MIFFIEATTLTKAGVPGAMDDILSRGKSTQEINSDKV